MARWTSKRYARTLTRTVNVKVEDKGGGWVRCGEALFPCDPRDPALLTVPLYWDGRRTLGKSPLRVAELGRE